MVPAWFQQELEFEFGAGQPLPALADLYRTASLEQHWRNWGNVRLFLIKFYSVVRLQVVRERLIYDFNETLPVHPAAPVCAQGSNIDSNALPEITANFFSLLRDALQPSFEGVLCALPWMTLYFVLFVCLFAIVCVMFTVFAQSELELQWHVLRFPCWLQNLGRYYLAFLLFSLVACLSAFGVASVLSLNNDS